MSGILVDDLPNVRQIHRPSPLSYPKPRTPVLSLAREGSKVRTRAPDCLLEAQIVLPIRLYEALVRARWLAHDGVAKGLAELGDLDDDVGVDVRLSVEGAFYWQRGEVGLAFSERLCDRLAQPWDPSMGSAVDHESISAVYARLLDETHEQAPHIADQIGHAKALLIHVLPRRLSAEERI